MQLSARATGGREIERVLAGMLARAGDLSPLMDHLGGVIETQTDERFEREEAPDGSKWTPSRRAKETGGKTLTDTARGMQSVTRRAGGDFVEVGTNVGYMAAHQAGATITPKSASALAFTIPGVGLVFAKSVTLPKREWLGLSTDNEAELVEEAQDWFAAAFPEVER